MKRRVVMVLGVVGWVQVVAEGPRACEEPAASRLHGKVTSMRTSYFILIFGLAAAGALGVLYRSGDGLSSRSATDTRWLDAELGPEPGDHGHAPERRVIRGQVRETIDVPGYRYLRLGAEGSEDTWAAVPAGAEVAEGQTVAVVVDTRMTDFTSRTLGRTFESIDFGSLEGSATTEAPGHHSAPRGAAAAPSVAVSGVARAEGERGRRVAEVYAQKGELAGQTVRIRGVVVKSIGGVMGRSFVHLQDGSGDAADGTHDITVTMHETPEVGATLLVEGVVTTDKDFGAGYRYAVILEEARTLADGQAAAGAAEETAVSPPLP